MAITPDAAIAVSPAAQLTPDDILDVTKLESGLDAHLVTEFSGSHTSVDLPLVHARVLATIVRRYREAGWNVTAEPVPSTTRGARGEVVVGGLRLTFVPQWRRAAVDPGVAIIQAEELRSSLVKS